MTRRDPLARVERRPRPEDWPDDEPMTFKEIIAVFYPDGPASIFVAEVAALYLLEKASKARDPSGVKARFKALLDFWREMTLADVKRSTCEAYVAERITHPIASAKDPTTARRVPPKGRGVSWKICLRRLVIGPGNIPSTGARRLLCLRSPKAPATH